MENTVAQRPEGRLVYPSIGMLGKSDEGEATPILYAYVPSGTSNIAVGIPNGEELVFESPTFAERSIIEKMSFSTSEGDYTIRPVFEEDGIALSQYGISLPVQAVKALISPENHLTKEERQEPMANYFKDGGEQFYALTNDDDSVVGLMYMSEFGNYKRVGGIWLAISPGDFSFDLTTPHMVNPETAEELVNMFDQKNLTAEEISDYVTPVK